MTYVITFAVIVAFIGLQMAGLALAQAKDKAWQERQS